MKYSGERILANDIFNVTYQQSLMAYRLAEQYAAGKTVLDVACGEGYGVAHLGKVARRAVGVDYNAAAVADANRTYGQVNVSYVQGDLFALEKSLKGEQFDVLCCFQTIEHVSDHDLFITSLAKALKPGGVMLVSTPNKHMFPSFNPYHLHEFAYDELASLFRRHFQDVKVYGVFGDKTVLDYRTSKQRVSDFILRLDFLRLREKLPLSIIKAVYAFLSFFVIKRMSLWRHYKQVVSVNETNFAIRDTDMERALDFIVVARSANDGQSQS